MLRSGLNLHYAEYLIALRNADTSLFRKADRLCGPARLYKIHSIMRTLASLSHKIVRHRWLIHQLDIILTLVIIVLASGYPFLPSYSKGELWNGAFVARISLCTDFLMRKKITGLPPNLDFNSLPTRFNLTEFLLTSMHSESTQHIKGEENK